MNFCRVFAVVGVGCAEMLMPGTRAKVLAARREREISKPLNAIQRHSNTNGESWPNPF
jgi:hypothetical protein